MDNLKKSLQLDWTNKPDARAAIRLAVKRTSREGALNELLKQVIVQAGQYKDWL